MAAHHHGYQRIVQSRPGDASEDPILRPPCKRAIGIGSPVSILLRLENAPGGPDPESTVKSPRGYRRPGEGAVRKRPSIPGRITYRGRGGRPHRVGHLLASAG